MPLVPRSISGNRHGVEHDGKEKACEKTSGNDKNQKQTIGSKNKKTGCNGQEKACSVKACGKKNGS